MPRLSHYRLPTHVLASAAATRPCARLARRRNIRAARHSWGRACRRAQAVLRASAAATPGGRGLRCDRFGAASRAAFDWSLNRETLGARVILVHFFDLPIVGSPMRLHRRGGGEGDADRERGSDGAGVRRVRGFARCRERGSIEAWLRQGDPREAVPSLATVADAGLVVVGSHGRKGVARALLGSVAESVIREFSSVPVVVVL